MKVRVDQLKCNTSGICVVECPDLFRFQVGSKKAEAVQERVPPELEKTCLRIAGLCPTGAIIIEE